MASVLKCGACGESVSVDAFDPAHPPPCGKCALPMAPVEVVECPPEVAQAALTARNLFGPPGADGQPGCVLLGPIAQDAMGAVYRAYDRPGKRFFAVRFVAGQAGEERTRALEREVEKSVALPHPNILHVQGTGRRQNRLYIAMDLVEGQPLLKAGLKEIRKIAAVLKDAAEAVDYAHGAGLFHGDLNPENLLVGREDHVYVKDFGLAHVLETTARQAAPKDAALTMHNPAYLPPEQVKEMERTPTVAGDVYGLGASLYAALTGRPPFEGEEGSRILRRVMLEEPQAPERQRPDVPQALGAIARRAMAKDPALRYASAQQMAEALARFLKGAALSAEAERFVPPAPARPAPRPPAAPRRGGARWALGAVAIVLLAGLVALAAAFLRPPGGPPPAPEPPGQLEFALDPAPSEVRVDGRRADPAAPLPLPKGRHKIEVLFGDAHRAEQAVDVLPGQVHKVEVRARAEIGRAWEERGRWADAERLYEEALARPLTAEDRRSFEEGLARARTKRLEAESFLKVESEPSGASVVLDGKPAGRTPLELKGVEAGTRVVEVQVEGYDPETRRVAFQPGAKETIRVTLKARTGKVRVKGLHAGDRVLLLGRAGEEVKRALVAAAGDLDLADIRLGEYALVVERAGHEDALTKVAVEHDRVAEVAGLAFKRKPGSLAVETDPAGAEVHVDGQLAGRAPLTLTDVAPGTKKIRLTHAEASDWEGEVRVAAGERAEVKTALPKLGKLVVEANPDGARVSGAVNGTTRAEARLKAGEHRVRVQHAEAGEVERAVRVRPGEEVTERVDLWELRALEHEKEGRLEEAARTYHRARGEARDKGQQRLFDAWLARAEGSIQSAEWVKARDAAAQALRLRPGDARARAASAAVTYHQAIARAEDATRKADWAKAREAVGEALALRPGDPRALELASEEALARGRELQRAGRWAEAGRAFQQALAARPGSREAAEALERLKLLAWTELRFFDGYAFSVAFAPGGRLLAAARSDKTVQLWETETGRPVHTLTGHTGPVSSAGFAPGGSRLASAAADGTVRIWDPQSGQAAETLQGHARQVWSVAWAPDGRRIASAGEDRTVRLWEAATWKEARTLAGHTGSVSSVAWSPDGRKLASAGGDRTVKLWDADRGEEIRTLSGHSGYVSQAAFAPGGKVLASASGDRTIKLWDVESGRELRTLSGHAGHVTQTAFSPDGKLLVSAGGDKSMRLWDVESGRELRTLLTHTGEVWSVAFSPDGSLLASAGSDGVRLWGLPK